MRHTWWLTLMLPFVLLTANACGLVEAEPAPQTLALVSPLNSGGKTFLFASNRYVDRVYRIDLQTLKVRAIDVGDEPRNLAASPDGSWVAVANRGSGSVSLIDAVSLHVQNVHTGSRPFDVRFSPDNRWLAVANYDDQSVSLIDAETFFLSNIWVGGGPASVAFDYSSRLLAVACYDENAVKLVDVNTKGIAGEWFLDQLHDDLSIYDKPQVVTFGLPDTPASRTLFVGLQDQDSFYDTDSYEYSIVTIQFTDEVYNDPLDFPSVVDVVRAGPNPRGFLWNHAGDRLLALNHFYIDYNLSETVDTVSVLQPVEDSETAAQHWRPAGDKRPPLPLLAPAPARWWMWLWPSKWREVVRYLVGDDPVAATLAPEADFVAIANRGSDSVSFIDLTTGGQRTFDTEARPGAVAFTNDHKVVVVHDTPLMPVSVIDLQTGESKTVYKSLSMDEWIE